MWSGHVQTLLPQLFVFWPNAMERFTVVSRCLEEVGTAQMDSCAYSDPTLRIASSAFLSSHPADSLCLMDGTSGFSLFLLKIQNLLGPFF